MADLTTVADLRTYLGLTGTADDLLLARLVSAASASAQQLMSRQIVSASYTETRNGTGSTALFADQSPIQSVTSVVVDGITIPARTAPGGAGYSYDDVCIYLDGYTFSRGRRNVVVMYTAGYASVPYDLAQAVLGMAAHWYRQKERIGLTSKTVAGETSTFAGDLPPHMLRTLEQYQRTVYGA